MTRVRKARKSSTLICGHYIIHGQLIVNRGPGWICLDCALEHIRELNISTEGKRP